MWTGLRTTSSTPDSNSRSVFSSECCSLSAMTGAPVRSRILRGEHVVRSAIADQEGANRVQILVRRTGHPLAEFARAEACAGNALAVEK